MSTTVTSFKRYVAADVLPCPDPIVEREILSTLIDFCDKTHIVQKEFVIELDSEDELGDRVYAIDEDLLDSIDVDLGDFITDYKPITVLEFNLDGTPKAAKFRELTTDVPDDVWNNIKEDETIYFSFPAVDELRLFDMSEDYSHLFVRMAVKPIRDAATIEDFLIEDWVDTIAAGAKWKIMSMPNKEWSDPKAAAIYYVEYRRGISRARMKALKSYTNRPLEVSPRAYGQIEWE